MSDARRASNVGSRPINTVSRLGIVVLCLVLSGSLGWAQSPPPAVPQVSDWAVFASKGCAGCHRIRGFGDGTIGPDLGQITSGTGFIEIAAAMWNHGAQMRGTMRDQSVPWPRFTPRNSRT